MSVLGAQLAASKPLSFIPRQVESNGTYVTGPVMAQNFPDPSIVYAEGYWWAFATMDQNINIQVARSSDFQEWTYLSGVDALPDPPNWVNMATPNTWAPDVNVLVGTFSCFCFSWPLGFSTRLSSSVSALVLARLEVLLIDGFPFGKSTNHASLERASG